MVTKQQIEIYLKYQDIDFFTHAGSKEEKSIMGEDWVFIDDLLQDIHFLKNNLVSSEKGDEIKKRICQYTEGDKELAEELFNIK